MNEVNRGDWTKEIGKGYEVGALAGRYFLWSPLKLLLKQDVWVSYNRVVACEALERHEKYRNQTRPDIPVVFEEGLAHADL